MDERRDHLDEFLDYLRAGRVEERFLPAYRTAAQEFLDAFSTVRPSQLGVEHLRRYLEHARTRGASARRLRNLEVACGSFLMFVHQKAAARRSTQKGRRKVRRVDFVREVHVRGLGWCRSSDLSLGGMYLETIHALGMGTRVELEFRLWPEDTRPLRVGARVVYEQPELGAGLVFVDVPQDVLEQLRRFVRQSK
jgi:hypothetical protein